MVDIASYAGEKIFDSAGSKIGEIAEIYADDSSGRPEWVAVKTGMFGSNLSFLPISHVQQTESGELTVPYTKEKVKDAPRVEADGHLEEDEERRLYEHYGVAWGDYQYPDYGTTYETGQTSARGRTKDRASRGGTDNAMTRSEEELRVNKVRQERGSGRRARLRKYVETEQQTITVPVQKEVARLETEPITDANREQAFRGPDITESEHEVVLSEEQVKVDKVAVPKERVRLATDTVTEDQQVTEEVRKERIEAEGDVTDRNTRRR